MRNSKSGEAAVGFSADEARALFRRVSEIANSLDEGRRPAVMDAVKEYLIAEPQRVATKQFQEQEAPLKRIVEFERSWLEGVPSDPSRPSEADLDHLESLLRKAREEPVAYEAAKQISREMIIAQKKPQALMDFVSDDWAGLVKPASRTRRKRPQDWFRQEQIAASVYALVSVGFSQREAISVVVDAAQAAGIVWSKTYAPEPVTYENIRGAWRASDRFQRLYRRLD